jgi:hypothetical protein
MDAGGGDRRRNADADQDGARDLAERHSQCTIDQLCRETDQCED